jgi:hypothetical protein
VARRRITWVHSPTWNYVNSKKGKLCHTFSFQLCSKLKRKVKEGRIWEFQSFSRTEKRTPVEKYGTYTAANGQIRAVYSSYFTVIQAGVLRPYSIRIRHAYERIRHKYGVAYAAVLRWLGLQRNTDIRNHHRELT